jgi:hypothetical protein
LTIDLVLATNTGFTLLFHMSLSRTIASPSRLANSSRSLHTTSLRFAAPPSASSSSPKPARSYQRPTLPPPSQARRAVRPVRPVVAEPALKTSRPSSAPADKAATTTPASAVKADEWAWTRVAETEPGWITEERTIFARPQDIFAGEPGRIKFAWVFAATIIVSVIAVPSVDALDLAKDKA